MSEPLRALPSEWVSRLFSRFQAIYGNKVATMWADADLNEVRAVWGDGLGHYDAVDIKRSLETMIVAYPDYPPTLPQFVAMCRDSMRARKQVVPAVTVRYGGPSAEVLAAVHELAKEPAKRKVGPRDWARRLLKRELDGEPVHAYALQCAKEALNLGVVSE